MGDAPLVLCEDERVRAKWIDDWIATGWWNLDKPPIEEPFGFLDEKMELVILTSCSVQPPGLERSGPSS